MVRLSSERALFRIGRPRPVWRTPNHREMVKLPISKGLSWFLPWKSHHNFPWLAVFHMVHPIRTSHRTSVSWESQEWPNGAGWCRTWCLPSSSIYSSYPENHSLCDHGLSSPVVMYTSQTGHFWMSHGLSHMIYVSLAQSVVAAAAMTRCSSSNSRYRKICGREMDGGWRRILTAMGQNSKLDLHLSYASNGLGYPILTRFCCFFRWFDHRKCGVKPWFVWVVTKITIWLIE